MTRKTFEKIIALDTDIDAKTVAKVLESMEDLIFEVIAMEDSVKFTFGTISGFTREPRKVTGYFSIHDTVISNRGWSVALSGKAKIDWSKKIKHTTPISPREYFELPENRYTTKARFYRQDVGDPEIPEYEGLSEERIKEACEKADVEKYGQKTERAKAWIERHEKCRKKIKKGLEYFFIAEDIENQRKTGIPEEEIVIKTKEDILRESEKQWIAEKERRKQENAKIRKKQEAEREAKKKRNYKIN